MHSGNQVHHIRVLAALPWLLSVAMAAICSSECSVTFSLSRFTHYTSSLTQSLTRSLTHCLPSEQQGHSALSSYEILH